MELIDRKHAFEAPAAVFLHPSRVLESSQLSHDEKVVVLRNWKRMLEVVQESGGPGPELDTRMAAVSDALNVLTATPTTQH